jgi:hypothetical protein
MSHPANDRIIDDMRDELEYVASLQNRQGAWLPAISGTKAEINRELKTYYDPEDIGVTISDGNGNELGYKPFGKKTISWSK